MKIKLSLASLLLMVATLYPETEAHAHKVERCKSRDQVYCQILKNSPQINKAFARRLSTTIRAVSKKRKVPRRILTAILMQESSYRLNAVRKECGVLKSRKGAFRKKGCIHLDFGISQVYFKTAAAYAFDLNRLTSDLHYSVDAGAQVLSWFYKTYSLREPDQWFARYNCGTARLVSRTSCQKYIKQVRRWM